MFLKIKNADHFVQLLHMSIRKNGEVFCDESLRALYDYLIRNSTGCPEYHLDIDDIKKYWTIYHTIFDVTKDFPNITSLQKLRNLAIVLEFDGGIIVEESLQLLAHAK